MGKIYSGAKHVFACVGPHADDSEYLMATVDRQRPILEKINKWGLSVESYDMIEPYYQPRYQFMEGRVAVWRRLRCFFTMPASERLRTSEAFLAFIRGPYFTRVWVLQELHLATRMSYCCGVDVQPGESFRALDSLVEYWINRLDLEGLFAMIRAFLRWNLETCIPAYKLSNSLWLSLWFELYRTVPQRSCLRLGVSAQKQGLDELLRVLRNFHCVDARDNLYGILSLVRWPEGQEPTPDYIKDNFEVAKHVLSFWDVDNELSTHNCSRLLKLFDVTLELESLRDAIALRSSVTHQAGFRIQSNHTSQIANVSTNWSGVQISDDDLMYDTIGDGRQPGPNSYYIGRERHGGFIRIQLSSTATVCAPVDTKVGDWCLTEGDHLISEVAYKLIVRESKNGEYLVVGPALAGYQNDQRDFELGNDSRSVRTFVGWLDIEDMMVMAWTLHPIAANQELSDKKIEEFVKMRVCGWKNSSYFDKLPENPPANSSYVC